VQPVPGSFTTMVDWPLQRLGADAARWFALTLGVPVGGEALRLMFFHDQLGMFIAPGCNGLQGAAAMGLLALIIGHVRRLRLAIHVAFVVAAVALAYVFNLMRLCALVVFYCVAHQVPFLANHAVGADYAIGGALFMMAAAFLFWVPRGGTSPR
jgi:exosortase J